MLKAECYFDPEPDIKRAAIDIYSLIKDLPIISPHGHIDPALFSDPNSHFGNPVETLLQPDHYILRMLYSQGIPFERLMDEENPRELWSLFASNFHLYAGTPSGLWLIHTLEIIFNITEKLNSNSADHIYDQIESHLSQPDLSPRKLFEKIGIEVLATTDPVTDALTHHKTIRESGWTGRIIPTFRADNIINPQMPNWPDRVRLLSSVSGVEIKDYKSYITAIEQRRVFFKSMGAKATDTSIYIPDTTPLTAAEAERIFQRAYKGKATPDEASQFSANMIMELARMSVEDGLVMQLHPGVYRNHNPQVFNQFGSDRGFDIPTNIEYTRNLKPLLDRFGNNPDLTLILFTLDENLYSRELAPLAGAYPAVRLGPPWWFYDSWNGIRRYFDQVMETTGIYNTVGFNDDTRTFLTIPARHDVWRRAVANWLAGLFTRHLIDRQDAESMAFELSVGLARKAYRLEQVEPVIKSA